MVSIANTLCTRPQDAYSSTNLMQQQNTTTKRIFTRVNAPQPPCAAHDRGACSGRFRPTAAPRGIFLRAVREAHGG